MIIPNSNIITCDASLRVKLGSAIMLCQRATLKPYRRACRIYGQDYSFNSGLELGQTHWILYEYWVVTGGSGCVLTTNSVILNDAAAPFDACQSRRSKMRGRRRGEYARRIGPDCEPHLRVQWYCLRVQLRPLAHGRALNPKDEKQARGRQLPHVLTRSASVDLCHDREHAGSENAPPIPTCRMNSNMSVNRPLLKCSTAACSPEGKSHGPLHAHHYHANAA